MGFDPYADAGRKHSQLASHICTNIQVRYPEFCRERAEVDDYRHLKPGFGWLEHVEIDMEPRCDDGTLPADSSIIQWSRLLFDATERAYRPLAYNHETGPMLQRAGFVDIKEEVIKIPLNPWESDPHQKDIGRWYNLGLTQGLEALTTAPLTRMSQWTKADVDRLIADVKREVCSKRFHVYCNM